MKRREIEKRLNKTISGFVPDVLDNILAQCENKEGLNNMNFIKEKKKEDIELIEKKENRKSFFAPKLVGALATVMICVFGLFGFTQYQKGLNTVDSIIDFDVNPSVELKINKSEEIIGTNALNEEGKQILKDMDLEKVDLDVGVNAIIGSMLKNGYITEAQNSILVSVKNEDSAKAKDLETRISNDINKLLNSQNIQGSVLSQMYNDDEQIKNLAQTNNISEGKANLINKVITTEVKDSKGNAYTFEELSKLSINELNLLLNSKKVSLNEVTSTGNVNEKSYIGNEKAKEIAFNDAGVTSTNITELEIELDCDDGILIYEVEFKSGSNEYDYDINAKDGNIIKKDIDINDDRYDDDDDWDDDRYEQDDDDDDDWDDDRYEQDDNDDDDDR